MRSGELTKPSASSYDAGVSMMSQWTAFNTHAPFGCIKRLRQTHSGLVLTSMLVEREMHCAQSQLCSAIWCQEGPRPDLYSDSVMEVPSPEQNLLKKSRRPSHGREWSALLIRGTASVLGWPLLRPSRVSAMPPSRC